MAKLPDFDTLLRMHRQDPEYLDRLREKLTGELLGSASAGNRRRLEGLQFRINIELKRTSNPTSRYVKIYSMMQDAFCELRFCLRNPHTAVSARQKCRKAVILPMLRNDPVDKHAESNTSVPPSDSPGPH